MTPLASDNSNKSELFPGAVTALEKSAFGLYEPSVPGKPSLSQVSVEFQVFVAKSDEKAILLSMSKYQNAETV